jgi:pyruvate/2-oxoglutarate dehydrogenase complex dihydrolipoamide dehydrogenase (E3) component
MAVVSEQVQGADAMQPFDEHNRELVSHVRPGGWINPTPQERYHLVVVGGGTAGLVTAAGAAAFGAKVALVEQHLLGGDCLNVGCVPSKAVLGAAREWHRVFHGQAFGAPPHIGAGNFAKAMERMRRLRARIGPHDSAARFAGLGVDVFFGQGRFVAADALQVEGARLEFRRAVIASGSRPATLPVAGLEEAGYLTNETVFSLTSLPRRLAVVGGGPIGCELSQAFCRFGSKVTVFDIVPRLLPRDDLEAASLVAAALAREGVRLELGAEIERVEVRGDEKVLHFRRDGALHQISVDALLLAVGRRANVAGMGLEKAGVEHSPKGVRVDERFRTSNPRIFACGDVASPWQLTHAADAQARAVLSHALFRGFGGKKADQIVYPWCTYTSPEVAHVGMLPDEARSRGFEVRTLRVEMTEVDRAVLDGEEEGFLKVHLAGKSDRVLGATLVAAAAGDLIAPLCLAVTHRIGLRKIASTVHPYPTRAEVVRKAADLYNRGRLSPFALHVARMLMALAR